MTTELKPEIVDVWNTCDVDSCEIYVAARSHSLPTDSEKYEACQALGEGWQLDPDQSGVRCSFVRCLKPIPAPSIIIDPVNNLKLGLLVGFSLLSVYALVVAASLASKH